MRRGRAGSAIPYRGLVALHSLLAFVGLGVVACAPRAAGPFFAPHLRPIEGGELVVYRVDIVPSRGNARVRVGTSFATELANGEYMRIALAPGPHLVELQFRGLPWTWGWDAVPIRLKDGEVLYLRLSGGVRQTNTVADELQNGGPGTERYGPVLLRDFATTERALSELRDCRLSLDLDD